jgi:two-component system OmpR family response regulator/two-component system alkaline phosphatase synthesis response regulator PhoP
VGRTREEYRFNHIRIEDPAIAIVCVACLGFVNGALLRGQGSTSNAPASSRVVPTIVERCERSRHVDETQTIRKPSAATLWSGSSAGDVSSETIAGILWPACRFGHAGQSRSRGRDRQLEATATTIETATSPGPGPQSTNPGRSTVWLVLADEGSDRIPPELAPGQVTSVAIGSEFMRLLRELVPRVVVMSAPPAGQTEMLAAIAQRRRRRALRLILLNDPLDVPGRLHALALGFDEALPRSVDPEELIGRARLLLEGGRLRAVASRYKPIARGIRLDVVSRRLQRAGMDIHLRPKEYALLAVLAAYPGRVFSRRELVARAWGVGYTGGPRTVDVHVRWLRAKIEVDPANPAHLMTVHGAGYRLDPPEV